MAYIFSSNTQSLSSSLVITPPFTMAGWFNVPTAADRALLTLTNQSNLSGPHFVIWTGAFGFSVGIGVVNGASFSYPQIGTSTANAWFHITAIFVSSTSRRGHFNGGAAVNNTTNVPNPTVNLIAIPSLNSSAVNRNNMVAEVGVWNTDLNTGEAASLAKGMACNKIRPQNLVFYSPLIRDLQDTKGGLILTPNNNPTVAAHPRIYK